jgi:hypothetical protein
MIREEALEFIAEAMGVNALDTLIQGVEDPSFDPERPYRGKLRFEDLSESMRMVIELGEYAQTMANLYADYQRQECFIQTSLAL